MSSKLLVTIQTCGRDSSLALKLMRYIANLGGTKDYDLLYTIAPSSNKDDVDEIKRIAKRIFSGVIVNELKDEWTCSIRPDGHRDWLPNNWMFSNVLDLVCIKLKDKYDSFYYFEPDCVPLKSGWLSDLEAEYRANSKSLFMGSIREMKDVSGNSIGMVMNGSGIYSVKARSECPSLKRAMLQTKGAQIPAQPWDVYSRHDVVPKAHHTNLIQVNFKLDPWIDLDRLNVGALVFHGCKDGTLIDILSVDFPELPKEERASCSKELVSSNKSINRDEVVEFLSNEPDDIVRAILVAAYKGNLIRKKNGRKKKLEN